MDFRTIFLDQPVCSFKRFIASPTTTGWLGRILVGEGEPGEVVSECYLCQSTQLNEITFWDDGRWKNHRNRQILTIFWGVW